VAVFNDSLQQIPNNTDPHIILTSRVTFFISAQRPTENMRPSSRNNLNCPFTSGLVE